MAQTSVARTGSASEVVCHHYCNCELRCPECIKRFWKWAEMHTNGRKPKAGQPAKVSFYEAAATR